MTRGGDVTSPSSYLSVSDVIAERVAAAPDKASFVQCAYVRSVKNTYVERRGGQSVRGGFAHRHECDDVASSQRQILGLPVHLPAHQQCSERRFGQCDIDLLHR